jgi:hypothetical protein
MKLFDSVGIGHRQMQAALFNDDNTYKRLLNTVLYLACCSLRTQSAKRSEAAPF